MPANLSSQAGSQVRPANTEETPEEFGAPEACSRAGHGRRPAVCLSLEKGNSPWEGPQADGSPLPSQKLLLAWPAKGWDGVEAWPEQEPARPSGTFISLWPGGGSGPRPPAQRGQWKVPAGDSPWDSGRQDQQRAAKPQAPGGGGTCRKHREYGSPSRGRHMPIPLPLKWERCPKWALGGEGFPRCVNGQHWGCFHRGVTCRAG